MEVKKLGIDETRDLINYASSMATTLQAFKDADIEISMEQIQEALKNNASEAMKAVWGSWEIPAELKDLDGVEAKVLLSMSIPVLLQYIKLFVG